jgi:Flp pilus assembly pilin Flp
MTSVLRWQMVINQLWRDRRAQDLIEYSLAAGFVAVAASAFFPPSIAPAISSIWGRIVQILGQTGAGS